MLIIFLWIFIINDKRFALYIISEYNLRKKSYFPIHRALYFEMKYKIHLSVGLSTSPVEEAHYKH